MIDHLLGRPSASWRRTQVVLVLLFWAWRLRSGDPRGPAGLRRLNDRFRTFTPWQMVVAILTCLYGVRHWDTLLGLAAPEPLARLYSRGFYRATWINTALDAGFATAAPIPLKWLRDVMSLLFSGYYLVYANEGDEKLRKFRAIPTVEVLRVTWEKTTNPIIHFFTRSKRPFIPIKRKFVLPRPPRSRYAKPITCWLYFSRSELDLVRSKNLVLDVPGGGFIAMSPQHHEERLIRWTIKTGTPILSVDYSKAPEYPFPYAIHECMDVYRLIQESRGRVVGMGRDVVDVMLTGDSAGANLSAAMIISILEAPPESPFCSLPLPVGILWMYAALDFNFTSWMSPENLKILRRDTSSADLPEGILEAKNHLKHRSPLSVVDDRSLGSPGHRHHRRRKSNLQRSLANLPSMVATTWKKALTPKVERQLSEVELALDKHQTDTDSEAGAAKEDKSDSGSVRSADSKNGEKSLGERILFRGEDDPGPGVSITCGEEEPVGATKQSDDTTASRPKPQPWSQKTGLGTRLTMTSRTGFFNDRIISPSMMRSMAICYIGPRNNPDLTKDYHISPLFAPPHLLSQFPPVYLVCGEKDPFVDDTVIIAGKIREAKRMRKLKRMAQAKKQGHLLGVGTAELTDPIVYETEADWVQMRIFEGWSHGFAQMLALLPEVSGALDLTAGFITSAFRKHDSRLSQGIPGPPSSSVPPRDSRPPGNNFSPTPSKATAEDEALTFTPRGRARGESSSPIDSPLPSFVWPRQQSSPKEARANNATSTPSALRLTPDVSLPMRHSTMLSGIPGLSVPVTPKSMVDFNVASAAAIVTPPVVEPGLSHDELPSNKEGNILHNHVDLLDRRREEAGYGLPAVATPEDHFRPLTELDAASSNPEEPHREDVLSSQYVKELELLERRRLEATYGLTKVGNHLPTELGE